MPILGCSLATAQPRTHNGSRGRVAVQVQQQEHLQDPALIQCMGYLPGWGEKNFQASCFTLSA